MPSTNARLMRLRTSAASTCGGISSSEACLLERRPARRSRTVPTRSTSRVTSLPGLLHIALAHLEVQTCQKPCRRIVRDRREVVYELASWSAFRLPTRSRQTHQSAFRLIRLQRVTTATSMNALLISGGTSTETCAFEALLRYRYATDMATAERPGSRGLSRAKSSWPEI